MLPEFQVHNLERHLPLGQKHYLLNSQVSPRSVLFQLMEVVPDKRVSLRNAMFCSQVHGPNHASGEQELWHQW